MNSVAPVEELIREFLLFRGYISTLKYFELERKNDRVKQFQVDKVVDHIFSLIQDLDLTGLLEFWDMLDTKFFSRIPSEYQSTASDLECLLKKRFLIVAVQQGRADKVSNFFDMLSSQLTKADAKYQWREWFVLPFLHNPELDPVFESFFTKQAHDQLQTSLGNFLSTVFQHLPLPAILSFNLERMERKKLEYEMETLKLEIARVTEELDQYQTSAAWSNLMNQQQKQEETLESRMRAASQVQRGSTLAETTPTAKMVAATAPTASSTSAVDRLEDVSDSSYVTLDQLNTKRWANTGGNGGSGGSGGSSSAMAAPLLQTTNLFEVLQQSTYGDHARQVNVVKVSPSGNHMATGSADKTVRIWSQDSSAVILCSSEVSAIGWGSSDRFVLCGTESHYIKLWSVDQQRLMLDLTSPSDYPYVMDIQCNPVSAHLFAIASGGVSEGLVQLWNMKTGTPETTFKVGPSSTLYSTLDFNHNGTMLLAGGGDGCVTILDVNSSEPIMGWPAHEGAVTCAKFSPDETSIITAGEDGYIREWSVRSVGGMESQFEVPQYSRSRPPNNLSFALSGDGHYMLTTTQENAGYIFPRSTTVRETRGCQRVTVENGPVMSVDWNHSNNGIVLAHGTKISVSRLGRRLLDLT